MHVSIIYRLKWSPFTRTFFDIIEKVNATCKCQAMETVEYLVFGAKKNNETAPFDLVFLFSLEILRTKRLARTIE